VADNVCPCDTPRSRLTISNSPGLSAISYRVGDFNSFREALLQALAGETQLTAWRPNAVTDLALQMIEWWAYLGDILTFYNERIANESYLGTATQAQSVRSLIALLGYRPRPGIAATGTVAALVSGKNGFTIPGAFSIDSKPGPGQSPQTFELSADTPVTPSGSVPALPPQYLLWPATNQFLIDGASAQVSAGDSLLLASSNPVTPPIAPALLSVTSTTVITTPANTKQTQVTFTTAGSLPAPMPASALSIQRSSLSVPLWTANGAAISGTTVQLASVARSIQPGSLVVFSAPNISPILATVESAIDVLWYLNPDAGSDPSQAPKPPTVPIGVLHTQLTVTAAPSSPNGVTVLFGWRNLGSLIDQPATSFDGSTPLNAVAPGVFPSGDGTGTPILIEDALGNGVAAIGTPSSDQASLKISGLPSTPPALTPPLNVLYNLLAVSRGKTVGSEILGSGNAAIAGQSFVLAKSPVTYLANGAGYLSTVSVWVNGRQWKEVASFYNQAPDAEVYVTSEDDQQQTHVTFGDGVNGARLPTGTNNITARYRYGSGASSPGAGQLTVISKPFPNVSSIRNPAPVGGGADPDPPDQIKTYAPRSVLTFGRAVSADDYEVIAAQAPGVTRAKSYWSWSGDEQRAVVAVYVGDDQAALTSAQSALAASSDPNKHVAVLAATAIPTALLLLVLVDPAYVPDDVKASVRSALLDPEDGLFATGRPGIGEAVFNSQIFQACLSVAGARSVSVFLFVSVRNGAVKLEKKSRHDPGEGAFFDLQPDLVFVFTEVDGHA